MIGYNVFNCSVPHGGITFSSMYLVLVSTLMMLLEEVIWSSVHLCSIQFERLLIMFLFISHVIHRVHWTPGIVCHLSPLMIRVFLQPNLSRRKDLIRFSNSEIRQNFVIANYHAVWPLDHDDGSCYYYDYDNVLVYGGFKTYLGHSKICMD